MKNQGATVSTEEFERLGLVKSLLKGIERVGFEIPSEIQRGMIPLALQGRDVMGQARTGTGKTAAFGLPILQQADPAGRLQAVILVPTRELAVQVAAELRRLAEFTQLRIVPVYGGQAIRHQLKVLGKKTHILVATPGRFLDMLNRKLLDISGVRQVVLDEVDRMLDIGFIDEVQEILNRFDHPHQTIFVSATLDGPVKKLAQKFMQDPLEVNVSQDDLTVDEIDQVYCSVERWDKFRLLQMVLKAEDPKLAIIFTNTKHQARKLTKKLHDMGVDAKEIHGDLVQQKRERIMKRFRRHQINVLVATDLASRGIDVQDITHIINYDLPLDAEVYVHRIGRTARMGAFGKAISFVQRDEGEVLTRIEMLINKEIPQTQFPDFTPRPPREQPESPKPVSRFDQSVFGATESPESPTQTRPPKTLGSKFKPARRRR